MAVIVHGHDKHCLLRHRIYALIDPPDVGENYLLTSGQVFGFFTNPVATQASPMGK